MGPEIYSATKMCDSKQQSPLGPEIKRKEKKRHYGDVRTKTYVVSDRSMKKHYGDRCGSTSAC